MLPDLKLPINWLAYHVFLEDFDRYVAGDWTVTETQAGATQALADGDGGLLLLTNSAADNDVNQLQLAKESFLYVAGKRLMFRTRLKVSDATQSDVFAGLIIRDTDLVGGVTDGFFFRKDDGDKHLDFVVVKNSTASTLTAVADMADDTYVDLAFYYDGATASILAFVNSVLVGALPLTNACDDEELAVTLSLTNGEAAAKTMTVDYVLAAKER